MDDETNDTTDMGGRGESTADAPGPVGEGIETKPRGNPDTDDEAVEKGEEALGRVKPY